MKNVLFLILATIVLTSACVGQPVQTGAGESTAIESSDALTTGTKIGNLAPDFERQIIDGEGIKLSDYRGKYVILNNWAAWCPFCIDELSMFERVMKEQDPEKVVLIAVDRGESIDVQRAALQKYEQERNIKFEKIIFVDDPSDTVATQLYNIRGMPVTNFIDPEGKIVAIKIGPFTESEFRETLGRVMK